MKFGLRKPSFKKRIAARTSWKRVVRHNLGLKAPRGWGWLTNPKKAAYNRAYSRTSVGIDSLFKAPAKRSHAAFSTSPATSSEAMGSADNATGCGCLLTLAAMAAMGIAGAGPFAVVPLVLYFTVAALIKRGERRRAREAVETAARAQTARAAAEAAEAARQLAERQAAEERRRVEDEAAAVRQTQADQERWKWLNERFGAENAQRIWRREIWQGASVDMIIESLGRPVDISERVLKTKTKHVYKYESIGTNRYALKVTFENGIVVGWDDNR